jgi:hypothetical protein
MAETAESAAVLADLSSLTSHTNEIFMGETVRSFRTLLKRYTMSEMISLSDKGPTGNATNGVVVQRPSFPLEPGFSNTGNPADPNSVAKLVQTKPYVYGYMTPLRFIAAGYVGWRGSVRWKVSSSLACCNNTYLPYSISRFAGCTPANISEVVPDRTTNSGLQQYLIAYDEGGTLQEGGQLSDVRLEPVLSFEAPFYTSRRFLPARSLAKLTADEDTQYKPCWKLGYEFVGTRPSAHGLYCAAGEDFTLGMFIGAPIVFLESIPPI